MVLLHQDEINKVVPYTKQFGMFLKSGLDSLKEEGNFSYSQAKGHCTKVPNGAPLRTAMFVGTLAKFSRQGMSKTTITRKDCSLVIIFFNCFKAALETLKYLLSLLHVGSQIWECLP